jgi:hypothetical protein
MKLSSARWADCSRVFGRLKAYRSRSGALDRTYERGLHWLLKTQHLVARTILLFHTISARPSNSLLCCLRQVVAFAPKVIIIACLRQVVAFAPKIIIIACLRQVVAFAPKVIIIACLRQGFAFAKQGNKMRRLRRRTREGAEVWFH